MQNKADIIKKLLAGECLSDADLLFLIENLDNSEFRPLAKRIFDLNNGEILNQSLADVGILGFINRIEKGIKNKIFKTKIESGFRAIAGNKVIVAEGDSWFEYPIFIQDITDWLSKEPKLALYTMASGADWLSNMLYEEKYIEELKAYQPDIFLISGGGNDLLGGFRLTQLVDRFHTNSTSSLQSNKFNIKDYPNFPDYVNANIDNGFTYLNKDFYALLNLFKVQYFFMFVNLVRSEKFNNLKIITHGYDFPIPNKSRNTPQSPIGMLDNGNWLYRPLERLGIIDSNTQIGIIAAMIFEYNEMLLDLTQVVNKEITKINPSTNMQMIHIDCRGTLKDKEDWADELHPKSEGFKLIADRFKKVIFDI